MRINTYLGIIYCKWKQLKLSSHVSRKNPLWMAPISNMISSKIWCQLFVSASAYVTSSNSSERKKSYFLKERIFTWNFRGASHGKVNFPKLCRKYYYRDIKFSLKFPALDEVQGGRKFRWCFSLFRYLEYRWKYFFYRTTILNPLQLSCILLLSLKVYATISGQCVIFEGRLFLFLSPR